MIPLLGLLLAPAAEAAPFAYITNRTDGTVSIIDAATGTPVGDPVEVGLTPLGVAVAPGGARAYITNFGDNTVSVLDTATRTVTDTVAVGNQPFGAAVTPDGSRLYVTSSGAATISVVDTAAGSVVNTIVLVGVNSPTGIAVAPDGTRAYAALSASAKVAVVQTATNTVGTLINVGANPTGVAVTPDGSRVLVTNKSAGSVSVLDAVANTVEATVPVGIQPIGVAVAPDSTKAYVANSGDGTVSVIDLGTMTGATITVGSLPRGLALTPNGALLHVAKETDGEVSVIDTATNTEIGTVAVGTDPYAFGQFIEPPGCGDGMVGPGEACDDGNIVGGDCCSPDCQFEPDGNPCGDGEVSTCRDQCTAGVCTGTTCPDSFKCYRTKSLRQPAFVSTTVSLSDDFANNQSAYVRRPFLICNPAGIDGGGLVSPDEHLTCYYIFSASLGSPKTVESQDAFGAHTFKLQKPTLMCVPSSKTVVP